MTEKAAKINALVGVWLCFMVVPLFVAGAPKWLADAFLTIGLVTMATSLLALLVIHITKGH